MKCKKVVGLVFLLGSMSLSAMERKKNHTWTKFYTIMERCGLEKQYYEMPQNPNNIIEKISYIPHRKTSRQNTSWRNTSRIVTRKKYRNKKDLFTIISKDEVKFMIFLDSMGNYVTQFNSKKRHHARNNGKRYKEYEKIFKIKDNKTK